MNATARLYHDPHDIPTGFAETHRLHGDKIVSAFQEAQLRIVRGKGIRRNCLRDRCSLWLGSGGSS